MKSLRVYVPVILIVLSFILGCAKGTDEDLKEVKEAVRSYDEALIKVYSVLDPKPLYGLASEKEIGRVRMIIWKFLGEKTFMESELKEIRFQKVEMKGDSAEVETREKWRFRHLREGTREEVRPWADAEYNLRFVMKKEKGKWMVESARLLDQG